MRRRPPVGAAGALLPSAAFGPSLSAVPDDPPDPPEVLDAADMLRRILDTWCAELDPTSDAGLSDLVESHHLAAMAWRRLLDLVDPL